MKDKFQIFNDIKVDIDQYEEVKFENNDELKKKMKLKIRNNKKNYKRIVAASLILTFGSGVIFSETGWASIMDIWYTIDKVFTLKKDEIQDYTYNVNKEVEDKNIKILFKSIMLDDGKFIIDTNIDDTKFNPFRDFTKKQQKDWLVEKWGDEETIVSLGADSTDIYVDGEKLTYRSNAAPNENEKNENGTVDVLIEQSIDAIETENGLEEISEDKFPNNIDKDKIYNLEIRINKLHIGEKEYTEDESKTRSGRYGGVIEGDWGISVDIKGKDLVNASTKYEVNNVFELKLDDRNIEVLLDSINISPVYVGLEYSYIKEEGYDIRFKLFNDKNEEYQYTQIGSDSYIGKEGKSNFEMKMLNAYRDTKYIKIVPTIINYKEKNTIEFEDEAINIKIYN